MIHHGLNPAQTPLASMLTYIDHFPEMVGESEGSDTPWWEE
jgi:hypothetical protein